MHEIKCFYSNLFGYHETNLNECNAWKLLSQINTNKLSSAEAQSMEGYLTIDEVSNALQKTKHNKTPGLDGLPSEFYKVFWKDLKYPITNAINTSFDKGILPLSLRQCVITCLPKKGKTRDNIKNWRPLSMLSVVYKLASAAIANRIKPFLNDIIDSSQCGFVPGRYIGDCTRLVYDIMKHTEEKQIPGMLVLIDFEKAFDSISWSFIYKTLEYLGFSETFIQWVKLFNNNIKATVIQSGFLSDFFDIKRGCRQGDPISAILFIIAGQMLTLLLKHNEDIKGITIGNINIKLTQFADDTTLILNGTTQSLQAAFNTLEIYGSMSGLEVNKDKTQIVWIGKKKRCKERVKISDFSLNTTSDFKLLGIIFNTQLEQCTKVNINEKIIELRDTISKWNKRYLTPLGKITIVKTFLLSKLIHIFTALPDPDSNDIKELNHILFSFIWSGKPDKINRKVLIMDKLIGGLSMIKIKPFLASIKVSWIRRLLFGKYEAQWITLFNETLNTNASKFILYGSQYQTSLKNRTKNKFWINVFDAWSTLFNNQELQNTADLLTSPLWYNPKISDNMYLQTWSNKGINFVLDVINDQGFPMEMNEIKQFHSFQNINPLHYLRVRQTVKLFLKKEIGNLCKVDRPFVPFHTKMLCANLKGVKGFYKNLTGTFVNDHSMKNKWNKQLEIDIDNQAWKTIFTHCFNTVSDNNLKWFQLKLIYRILGTKSYTMKLNITDSDKCNFCHQTETLMHMFVECLNVKELWAEIAEYVYNKIHLHINFSNFSILFGYMNFDQNKVPINILLLVTKKYIFDSCSTNNFFSFYVLKHRLQRVYEEEKYVALLNNKEEKFFKIWKKWEPVFLCDTLN